MPTAVCIAVLAKISQQPVSNPTSLEMQAALSIVQLLKFKSIKHGQKSTDGSVWPIENKNNNKNNNNKKYFKRTFSKIATAAIGYTNVAEEFMRDFRGQHQLVVRRGNKETPLPLYLGVLMHVKNKKKRIRREAVRARFICIIWPGAAPIIRPC